jgi:hypothetical protein
LWQEDCEFEVSLAMEQVPGQPGTILKRKKKNPKLMTSSFSILSLLYCYVLHIFVLALFFMKKNTV